MTTQRTSLVVSRRSTLAALAGGGLGLALHAAHGMAVAQGNVVDYSDHPMTGIWLGITPDGPSPAFFQADGAFLGSSSPISLSPNGDLQFVSQQNGIWEPDPEVAQGIHFTSVQNVHDAAGAFTGTITVDGYPVASEDGQSFYDDATRARVTLRDAGGVVLMVLGEDGSLPPVYGNRMAPGTPGFQEPAATPDATPES